MSLLFNRSVFFMVGILLEYLIVEGSSPNFPSIIKWILAN